MLVSVAHLNPLGDRSATLLDAPSRDGVYSRANMREDQMARLDDDAVKARLSEALQGTGIDPEAVAARMREGLGSSFKCNTRSLKGIGCCDGPRKQAPQQ